MRIRTFFTENLRGIRIILGICLLMTLLPRIFYAEQKEEQEQKQEEAFVPQMSIDSLSTLGIDVTLWAESQQSFEKLNDVKVERVSLSTHSFVGITSGLVGEFDWSVAKQYLKWQGNKTELFTNYGNRFVVFGNYVTLQDKLIFSGYLCRYG